MQDFCKTSHAHAVKAGFRQTSRAWQRVHAAAYNALCSAVIRTQTAEKLFALLLFFESPQKGQLIYEHIVDTAVPVDFQVETNFRSSASKISALRRTVQFSTQNFSPARYISSQYLADSSLSQDIARGSDPSAPALEAFDEAPESLSSSSSSSSSALAADADTDAHTDAVELDFLNANMCMERVVDVLDVMHAKFGKDWAALSAADAPPAFMASLLEQLRSRHASLHVRWFVAKLVMRRPAVFEKWAAHWFTPLVELATMANNGCTGFAYILRDLSVVFLDAWRNFMPAADDAVACTSACEFVSSLIERCPYAGDESKAQILSANLSFVRSLIERWRPLLHLSKSSVLSMIHCDPQADAVQKARVATGLQLLGLLCSNKFEAYDSKVRN